MMSLFFNTLTRSLRLIPAGTRGKTRLARTLLKPFLGGAADIKVVDRSGCSYAVPSLSEPIAFHLLIDGVYERDVLDFIAGRLRPGGTFVDVGANIGVLAVPIGARADKPTVVAIEASPRIFAYLQQNVQANKLNNIRCFNVVAAAEQCQLPFYDAPSDHFGMGSRAPQFQAEPALLPGRSLDSILSELKIENVDVLKIDVEGFEADVLAGARNLLMGQNPPLIVFEFLDWAEQRVAHRHVGAAQDLLRQLGYSIWTIQSFKAAAPPLEATLVKGGEMLVAQKHSGPARDRRGGLIVSIPA
jgi:FkbM family methyltransferase